MRPHHVVELHRLDYLYFFDRATSRPKDYIGGTRGTILLVESQLAENHFVRVPCLSLESQVRPCLLTRCFNNNLKAHVHNARQSIYSACGPDFTVCHGCSRMAIELQSAMYTAAWRLNCSHDPLPDQCCHQNSRHLESQRHVQQSARTTASIRQLHDLHQFKNPFAF